MLSSRFRFQSYCSSSKVIGVDTLHLIYIYRCVHSLRHEKFERLNYWIINGQLMAINFEKWLLHKRYLMN